MLGKVDHSKTLAGYGLDPVDPMADTPVSFDVSLASYGSYWRFLGTGLPPAYRYMELFFLIERIPYEYKVFSGIAPDVFGPVIPFPFKSYLLWYISFGETIVDYTVNNTDPVLTIGGENQYFKVLSASGFRVRNRTPGENVFYQLVILR